MILEGGVSPRWALGRGRVGCKTFWRIQVRGVYFEILQERGGLDGLVVD